MLKFLRESRDEETICDVYLKKIIHHSDTPVQSTPQKVHQEDHHHHHHHHHKKVKFFHLDFIRKLFKIPKNSYNYSFNSNTNKFDNNNNNNNNKKNNNHNERDEVDNEASLPSSFPQTTGNSVDTISHQGHCNTPPTCDERPNPDSESSSVRSEGLLKWSMREVRVLKYCTLKGLMRSLTAHDTGDLEPSVVHVFLATFRSYTTVEEVLRCLIERYAEVKKDQTMRNSIRENSLKNLKMVFLMWLYLYPSDFSRSSPTDDEQGQEVTQSDGSIDNILTGHAKDGETKESKQLRMLTEFIEANLNDHESIDKQLVSSIRAVAANQNLAPPTPSLKLSCNHVPYAEGDARPPLDRTGPCSSSVTDFDNFKPTVVAELLTRMDADLFLNVILHQCLGSVWGKRNRPGKGISKSSSSSPLTPSAPPSLSRSSSSSSSTVQATIEQFNALVYRVMTCVLDESLTFDERAKVIERWIGVAQECRRLKNFSSLKAILSALQSSSIHRLSDTWNAVDRSYMSAFRTLAVLMSDVDNHKLCRDVLEKEGTGKSRSSEVALKINRKKQIHANKLRIHKSQGDLSCSVSELSPKKPPSASDVCDVRCEGTVPFLGTFLTDLTMIDTAHKDYVEVADIDRSSDNDGDRISTASSDRSDDDFADHRNCNGDDFTDHRNCNSDKSVGCGRYINFLKKHKEWEILVRMEILQKAASLYRMQPDMEVYRWMEGLPVYRESDYYKMSLRLQDKTSPASMSDVQHPTPATPTASASPTTKSTSTSSLLTSSRVFTSVLSLDSVSSTSSSSSSSSSSLHASSSSPFHKPSRLSTVDDSGVILLKFNNIRASFL